MDAPAIPRLVHLVYAFNGVVEEQLKKRSEKLLSGSIFLWRLLKLLLKILHLENRNSCQLFSFIAKILEPLEKLPRVVA